MEFSVAETSQLQQLRAEIPCELDEDENILDNKEEEKENNDENLNNKKSSIWNYFKSQLSETPFLQT
ncbi:uncharacterized protein OCT59_019621 [Rhizophagus irregularis]|uniref:uncharacterized protein n=1 Tax=Rhizophagus irregularis TaxID=588596 RepID=UPI0033270C74|nr:hypothetical protein OCT59_019621 [Rhizophagus irregularis]